MHYFPESGNSYKLALMLTLCGQESEPILDRLWRRRNANSGLARTPKRDGLNPGAGGCGAFVLRRLPPILLRLAERYDRSRGEDDAKLFEVLRWLFWDSHKLTGYMATYRFQRAFVSSPPRYPLWSPLRARRLPPEPPLPRAPEQPGRRGQQADRQIRRTSFEGAKELRPPSQVDHFDRSVVENQVELLTEGSRR